MNSFAAKRGRIAARMKSGAGPVGLRKDTSNLFRNRVERSGEAIEVRDFNEVLNVDTEAGWVEVEGMTPYAKLVDATLARSVMPCVVPQLKSITIGGAVSGLGIESSSFRHGLVHETVEEMEVLLADGDVVTCTPDNEHSDLFHGLPNSYGTLGYILRLRAKTLPVTGFVRLRHHRHERADEFFADLEAKCASDADFVDGVIFSPRELYVTEAQHVPSAPYTSDYTYRDIFYRSVQRRDEDFLTTHDYLWRWDTDWFWCSKNLGMKNPLLRRLAGRQRLNSVYYTKIMRWNARHGLTDRLDRMRGLHSESVIQDICIPVATGTYAESSMSMPRIWPFGAITPITRRRAPAMRTKAPSALASPKSSRLSFGPRTATLAPWRGSPGGTNRPWSTWGKTRSMTRR